MAMLYLRNKPIGAISSGASGGGHTIENPSGTDMTQRSNLQFTDADVADDSTNDRTEISVVRKLTQAEFDELTPEEQNRGVIVIKDANPIYVPSNNAVSVTADGVKTYGALLTELYSKVDRNRIGVNSSLRLDIANTVYSFKFCAMTTSLIIFSTGEISTQDNTQSVHFLYALGSSYSVAKYGHLNGTSPYADYTSQTASVPESGAVFTLYYNIVASTGVGDIDAEDVSFDPTVKNILPNTATDCQKAIDALCSPNYVILARTVSSVSLSNQNIGKYKFLILATEYGSGILATSVIPTGFFVDYPPLSAHATPQVGNTKNIYAKIDSVSGTLSSCSFTVTITNPSGDSNFKALLFGVY